MCASTIAERSIIRSAVFVMGLASQNLHQARHYDRQYLAVSANGERVIELTTDSQPTGNLAGCSSRKFTLSRWSAGRGKRSPLCVRFTVSIEVAMDEAADQLVETDSSAVIIRTIARITMQPLPRYGKARFIDLNGPLRMCMRIPQTRDIDG